MRSESFWVKLKWLVHVDPDERNCLYVFVLSDVGIDATLDFVFRLRYETYVAYIQNTKVFRVDALSRAKGAIRQKPLLLNCYCGGYVCVCVHCVKRNVRCDLKQSDSKVNPKICFQCEGEYAMTMATIVLAIHRYSRRVVT